MRALIVFVLLLAAGIGIAGYALGWFTATGNPGELKTDRDTVLGWFHSSTKDQETEVPATADGWKKDREEFQQQADAQFKAMDLSLKELRAKAKTGRAVTKERMNQTIDDLSKKTEAARAELRELKTATSERWDDAKTRLSASLQELKDEFEKACSRFMDEYAYRLQSCGLDA